MTLNSDKKILECFKNELIFIFEEFWVRWRECIEQRQESTEQEGQDEATKWTYVDMEVLCFKEAAMETEKVDGSEKYSGSKSGKNW